MNNERRTITTVYDIQLAAQEFSLNFYAVWNLINDPLPPTPARTDMPCCGASFYFPTAESFPKQTMPCPCEREGFYVVFYESEGAAVN